MILFSIELDIAQHQPVAGLGGQPIAGNHVEILLACRIKVAIGLKR
jgi:hypothetical protein